MNEEVIRLKRRFVGLESGIATQYGVIINGNSCEFESLKQQLKTKNQEDRLSLYFHQRLLKGELPQTIGGGIGQSRLCMYYLRKAHIGEIQASLWPKEMRHEARKKGIFLI